MQSISSLFSRSIYNVLPLIKSRSEAETLLSLVVIISRIDAHLRSFFLIMEHEFFFTSFLNFSVSSAFLNLDVCIFPIIKSSIECLKMRYISTIQKIKSQIQNMISVGKSLFQYGDQNNALSKELSDINYEELSIRKRTVAKIELDLSEKINKLSSLSFQLEKRSNFNSFLTELNSWVISTTCNELDKTYSSTKNQIKNCTKTPTTLIPSSMCSMIRTIEQENTFITTNQEKNTNKRQRFDGDVSVINESSKFPLRLNHHVYFESSLTAQFDNISHNDDENIKGSTGIESCKKQRNIKNTNLTLDKSEGTSSTGSSSQEIDISRFQHNNTTSSKDSSEQNIVEGVKTIENIEKNIVIRRNTK